MNLKTILFMTAVFACSRLANAVPNSVVMVGNLPDTNGGYVFDSQGWFAESFAVPSGSDNIILDGIAVSLQRQGHPVVGQNQFKIYSDNEGKPGKPLISFSFPTFAQPSVLGNGPEIDAIFFLTPMGQALLSPGKKYWLVATSSNTSQTDFFAWTASTSPSYGLPGATIGARLLSQDKGATWIPDLGDPLAFAIAISAQ